MPDKESSYLERALKSYIDDKFLSGFRTLFQKKNLPFSSILFLVLTINITALILNIQNVSWMTDVLLTKLVIIGFFIAIGLMVFSLLSAFWKNYTFQWIFIYVGVLAGIVFGVFLNLEFTNLLVQGVRSFFILVWIFIAVLTTFFALVYLFTSFSGKIIVYRKSENHIFMGLILRIGALGTLCLSGYILYVNFGTINAMIVAILGIASSLTFLIFSWAATRDKTSTNFITIMGLFNFYIVYLLSSSIGQAVEIEESNIVIEIILFIFIALYYIQSKVRTIDNIETTRLDSKEEKKRRVFFQQRVLISEYSKKIFGEFALVVMTIGITLGYSLVLLSLFIDPQLPFSSYYAPLLDIGIPLATHRLSSIIAMVLFLGSFILFRFSENFRDFVTNKYSFSHGMKVLGDTMGAMGRRIKERLQIDKVRAFGSRIKGKFIDWKERRQKTKEIQEKESPEEEKQLKKNEEENEGSIDSSDTSTNGKEKKKWKLLRFDSKKKNS